MPEIKHQQRNASPEISLAEIHIPDDTDWGAGTFTTKFSPRALPATSVIASAMINAPRFQIIATVNPNGEVPVQLGRADGTDPLDSAVFLLPTKLRPSKRHTLQIEFASWHIMAASLNHQQLNKKGEVVH